MRSSLPALALCLLVASPVRASTPEPAPPWPKQQAEVTSKRLRAGRGGPRPSDNDLVALEYRIWKRDGTLTGSSGTSGPSIESVGRLRPALARVVKTMTVGERRLVWIPARFDQRPQDGDDDDDDRAPPIDLAIDVTLASLRRAPPPPRPLGVAPASARRTSSGLAYAVLRSGTSTRHPGPSDRVTLNLTSWVRDGSLFQSAALDGQPASVRIVELPAGLREGLPFMRVGDRFRFWVPARLAYGDAPRRGLPAGPLTYEIELLSVD